MSIFEQQKNSRQLALVAVLALVLSICVGGMAYLAMRGQPTSTLPSSSVEPSVSEAPLPPSSSEEERVASEESAAPSSSTASSASAEPPSASVPIWTPPSVPVSSALDITPPTSVPDAVEPSLTVQQRGVHDQTGTYGSITLAADGITLKNKTITGDLILGSEIGIGEVHLQDVVVRGKILVNGGDTVTLWNVTASEMELQRPNGITALSIGGNSTLSQLTARNHVRIDESGLAAGFAGIKNAKTAVGAPLWQSLTLQSGALDSVTTDVQSNITVEAGAQITTLAADAKTHLTLDGTVSVLQVANDEVTYTQAPDRVEVREGYSAPRERGWAIGETEPSNEGPSPDRLWAPTVTAEVFCESGKEKIRLTFDAGGSHVSGYQVTYTIGTATTLNTRVTRQLTIDAPTVDSGSPAVPIVLTVYAVSRYNSNYDSDVTRTTVTVARQAAPTNLKIEQGTTATTVKLSFSGVAGRTRLDEYAVSATDGGVPLTLGTFVASGTAPFVYTCDNQALAPRTPPTQQAVILTVTAKGSVAGTAVTLPASATQSVMWPPSAP